MLGAVEGDDATVCAAFLHGVNGDGPDLVRARLDRARLPLSI
jgi:hypothetical protein